ncbi:hypothetical protein OIDMADRAFT_20508 [Oidiodendron maius Zn]|uniref:Uncharacterized protein n=1 Tax=Oidiodendron maius (strain Zn) TaxID=913774 RepID=A0A0C3H1Q8_OIDMZ|nr:hypothetical protein OIDMADRAFT_20508 [Oidiodendron maius Zn]
MEKESPHKAHRDLVRLELHPPSNVADFKSKPYPCYQSAGALASRMIIESSSYQTTPCSSPPREELSCPSQSLGIEIPFIADDALFGMSTKEEHDNNTNSNELPGHVCDENNNKKDKVRNMPRFNLSAAGDPLQESVLFDDSLSELKEGRPFHGGDMKITLTKAPTGDISLEHDSCEIEGFNNKYSSLDERQ